MAALYQLANEIENFEFEIDEETGEILNADDLEKLEMERDAKVENIGCWVKNMRSDIDALKAEEKSLADRRKRLEKKAESVSGYLQKYLGGQKFESSKVAITYRKSETIEVEPENDLPDEFWRVKTTREPAKTEIKKALKAGECFKGVSILENQKMTIK